MKLLATVFAILVTLTGSAFAKQAPEDFLKGKIIITDKHIPTSWSSVGSYVAELKGMARSSMWYDKKTGKLTVNYAAFFSQPVNDVQVMLVLYDITGGAHQQKVSTEQFMTKGDRVLFNTITFDKEDIEGNKKYLMTIELRHRIIAAAQFILREEGPHYSGKVDFSDSDTKANGDAK